LCDLLLNTTILVHLTQNSGCKKQLHKIRIRSTKSELLHRAKIKSLQMAVVIVSTFIICSTPYHLLELVYSYGSHDLVPELVAGALLTPFLFSRGRPFRCCNIISFNASRGVNIAECLVLSLAYLYVCL